MRFTTATIVAFIGMTNALPAPNYGTYPVSSVAAEYPEYPEYPEYSTDVGTATVGLSSAPGAPTPTAGLPAPVPTGSVPVPVPAGGFSASIPTGSVSASVPTGNPQNHFPLVGSKTQSASTSLPSASGSLQPGGGANSGSSSGVELDIGVLVDGILNDGKLSGIQVSADVDLDLEGVVARITALLKGGAYLDVSGQLNIGLLLDDLKVYLAVLPGGSELSTFLVELKAALDVNSKVDLNVLVPGLEALLSGSGKFDLGAALGVDVSGLIAGLKLLINASISGSGGLDIDVLLGNLESFLAVSGGLDLTVGVGLQLKGIIAQLKALLSVSATVDLDVDGIIDLFGSLLNGSIDFQAFVAATIKLSGGELLATLLGEIITILVRLGIDIHALALQIVLVLAGFVEGILSVNVSVLVGAVLNLKVFLSLTVKVGITLSAKIGATVNASVGAGLSVVGSIVGKVGGILGGLA